MLLDMPPHEPGAALPAPEDASVVHDVGGLAVPGGHVRPGLLFRFSGALLGPADLDALTHHGVRLVVDLRGDDEDRDPLLRWAATHGVAYHHEPIEVARPDLLAAWGSGLSPEDAEGWLREIYRHLVDHHGRQFAAAIGALSGTLPAAFGCSAGKDRTGLLATLIQTLLGADAGDVVRQYAAIPPRPDRLAPVVRRWRGHAGVLSPGTRIMLGAPPEVITATLDYITAQFGGVEPYLLGAGLEARAIGSLRQVLVASG